MTPSPRHPAQTLLPAETCIEALVVAGGNTALAAERLFGADNPNAVAYLTASIAQDPLAQENLNAQLRALSTLAAFDALNQARALLPAYVTDLEPQDFVKYFSGLLTQLQNFTAASASPATPQDAMQRLILALPPEARRAFLTLVAPGPEAPPAAPKLDAFGFVDPPSLTSGDGEPPVEPDVEGRHDLGSPPNAVQRSQLGQPEVDAA